MSTVEVCFALLPAAEQAEAGREFEEAERLFLNREVSFY
jgi:hypothetical protein